jgi:hypothetical protein
MGWPGWGYVGWGPVYPSYIWRGGVAVGYVATAPAAHVNFVPQGEVFSTSVGAHVVAGAPAAAIAAHASNYGGGQVASAPAAGGAHVAAAPGAGGSVASSPAPAAAMRGPAPSTLGIPASNVTHVSPTDKGTMMAKSFAHPSTATQMGAHPPTPSQPAAKPATAAHPSYRPGSRPSGGFHGGGGHR